MADALDDLLSKMPRPAAAARQNNMLAGASPVPPPAPPASTLDTLRGMAWDAGDSILNTLTSGVGSLRNAVKSSPTLNKVTGFLGSFGNALSNGVAQSPSIPQAFDTAKQLPDIMRQAQQSAGGR